MKVMQAYRFALDPSLAQELALRSHAGAARFAWNWGLAKCRERYAAEPAQALERREEGQPEAVVVGRQL
jgi:transposase